MKCWYLLLAAVVTFYSNAAGAAFANRNALRLVSSFLDENGITFVVFIDCGATDTTVVMKFFSERGVRVKIQTECVAVETAALLMVDNHKLGVVLNWKAEDSERMLIEAADLKLQSRLHYWLIVTVAGTDTPVADTLADPPAGHTPISKTSSVPRSLISALEPLEVPLDSHVTVASAGRRFGQMLLQDVYRVKRGASLTLTAPCPWFPGQQFPVGPRRDNYGGIVLSSATVVLDGDWQNFLDWRYKHVNSLTKFHFVLVEHVASMLNFRTNVTPVDSWGFPVGNTTDYDGVIGLLQRGEIEMASVGLLHKATRLGILDYAGETVCYEGAFLFLKPSLSDISNIYTLPFSRAVWITYLVTTAVLCCALHVAQRAEGAIDDSTANRPLSVSDSVLTAIGLVCQEGSTRDPYSVSSRIIFLSLLLLSLFLSTSYSAIIVSLLQTTSTAVNSLRDLMDSPFTLSMIGVATNMNYVNETTDPEIKELYFKHLFTQPYHKAFTTPEVGVARVRRGLHAFHGDAEAFRIISGTYNEDEKCRLKYIRMFSSIQLALTVRKGSPYHEHIRQRARWLKESGISDREYKYWIVQKPNCHASTESFRSVRLQDICPALLVYAYGLLLAVAFLIAEMLHQKLRCCNRRY